MLILIEHLPESVSEEEVLLLLSQYDASAGVRLIENKAMSSSGCCSCLMSLADNSQLVVNTIAAKLDGLYWQGVQISAHRLLYG